MSDHPVPRMETGTHAGSDLGSGFRRIWLAAGISNLGDGIVLTAMPLLVVSLTRDPVLVAVAYASLYLPWLLFALPSGALVDRVDRRWAMVSTDLARAAILGVLALLVVAGRTDVALVCVFSFALSSAETVFDPASEAIVPLVVPVQALPSANARLQGTTAALNNFVGPPLGAALFAAVAAAPFVLDAASFVASALIVLTLSGSYRAPAVDATQPVVTGIRDGLRWLFRHPVLRYTTPLAGLMSGAGYAVLAILVLFSQDVLGLGDLGYGALMGAFGVGALAGAFTAGRVIAAISPTWALRLPSWIMALSLLASGLVPEPGVAGVALAASGFAVSLWNVAHVSLRQQLVPDELRGRVAGCNNLVAWGSRPIGAALGGVAAAALGLRAPFVLAALLLAGGGIVALLRISSSAIADASGPG